MKHLWIRYSLRHDSICKIPRPQDLPWSVTVEAARPNRRACASFPHAPFACRACGRPVALVALLRVPVEKAAVPLWQTPQ